jgi:HK97 family phage portal protein
VAYLDFFKKKNAKTQLKNESFSFSDVQTFLDAFGITGDVSADKLFSATYYACMDIRCKAISKLPLKILKSGELGTEKADNHYLYSLLKRRPNPYMSTIDFLYAAEFQKLEHGNAFIYAPVFRGKVTGLYVLDSTRMTIYIDNAGIINKDNAVWYQYIDSDGKTYMFNYKEIIHLKNFTKDGLVGTPVKKYLAETIQNEQYATKFINNYWQNGVQGRAILQYTNNLDPVQVDKMRASWEKMTSGVKNAGRIIPVALGFELKEFNPNLVDSQFFELQGLTVRNIANSFGVKLYQLNDLDRATYSNVETQNRAFLSDTLQNVIIQWEQETEFILLTAKELLDGFMIRFNVDSLLRSDFKTRMEGYAIAIQNGIYSPANARKLEDETFIIGSDKLIVNGNFIPLEMVGQQYIKPDVVPK